MKNHTHHVLNCYNKRQWFPRFHSNKDPESFHSEESNDLFDHWPFLRNPRKESASLKNSRNILTVFSDIGLRFMVKISILVVICTWIIILKDFSDCSYCHCVWVLNNSVTINIMKRAWISRFAIALGEIDRDNKMKFCSSSNVIKKRRFLKQKMLSNHLYLK